MRAIPTVRLDGEGNVHELISGELVCAIERAAAEGRSAFGAKGVRIEVGAPPLQRRRLRGLPQMPRRLLREMITHQSTRFFRPSAGGLVVDAIWVHDHDASDRTDALAVAMDRELVTVLLEAASQSDVTVLDIVPEGAGVPQGLSLLSEEEYRRRSRSDWRTTARVATLTGILWAALLGGGIVRAAVKGAEIHSELARLRQPALQVQAVRRVMDTVATMLETLAGARAKRSTVGIVLGDLTTALPDSAVLSSVSLGLDGPVEVTGLALEPLRVLAALQHQGGRRTARLAGAPVLDGAGGRDWSRFTVRFETNGPR